MKTEEAQSHRLTMEHPMFFAGQYVSEVDLNSLVTWTNQRLNCGGLRDGWGIVSGLHFSVDPYSHDQVELSPGYGVSPTGEDIVLNEGIKNPTFSDMKLEDLLEKIRRQELEGLNLDEFTKGNLRPRVPYFIDVSIDYQKESSGSALVQTAKGCKDLIGLKCSRERVNVKLTYRVGCGDSGQARNEWNRKFNQESLGIIDQFMHDQPKNANATKEWFAKQLKAKPLNELQFLQSQIDQISDPVNETLIVSLLFYLIQDHRISLIKGINNIRQTIRAIPLCRIWVDFLTKEAAKSGSKEVEKPILTVSNFAPYRRSFPSEIFPAAVGQINPALVHWQVMGQARQLLSDNDVRIHEKHVVVLPESFGTDCKELVALKEMLIWDLEIKRRDQLVCLVHEDEQNHLEERIVACRVRNPMLRVNVSAERPVVFGKNNQNQTIKFEITIENDSNEEVTIEARKTVQMPFRDPTVKKRPLMTFQPYERKTYEEIEEIPFHLIFDRGQDKQSDIRQSSSGRTYFSKIKDGIDFYIDTCKRHVGKGVQSKKIKSNAELQASNENIVLEVEAKVVEDTKGLPWEPCNGKAEVFILKEWVVPQWWKDMVIILLGLVVIIPFLILLIFNLIKMFISIM